MALKLVLEVGLCISIPRILASIHYGPFYMYVRIAVHLLVSYFVKVSNHLIFHGLLIVT